MKRILMSILVAIALLVLSTTIAFADKPTGFDSQGNETKWETAIDKCDKIGSGLIMASDGSVVEEGYDQFGYNYQAHMFNGTYDGADRVLDGKYWGVTADYVDDKLLMHWSDDWLANEDCNHDGKLDRGLVNGVSDGISKGWTTNHVEGDYIDSFGNVQHYTDFVKIGYVGPGGTLWGLYEIVEEVYNDPAGGYNGLLTITEPGLGQYISK